MDWLNRLHTLYPELDPSLPVIQQAVDLLIHTFADGGKVLVCGNGGSAADSEHIVGELMKGYMSKRPLPPEVRNKLAAVHPEDGEVLASQLQGALPAISLVSHTALLTAFGNDVSADLAFAQQVYGYGKKGDVVWGISTSGNARNVVFASQTARALGLHTIALTGGDGGILKKYADVLICAPGETTPAIQEKHLPIYHAICAMLEQNFFER